jgi:hypothetical protein
MPTILSHPTPESLTPVLALGAELGFSRLPGTLTFKFNDNVSLTALWARPQAAKKNSKKIIFFQKKMLDTRQ